MDRLNCSLNGRKVLDISAARKRLQTALSKGAHSVAVREDREIARNPALADVMWYLESKSLAEVEIISIKKTKRVVDLE